MDKQINEQIDRYIALLNSITEKIGDTDSAAVIFQEVLRDKRSLKRAEKRVINGNAEPTENQIQYLKKLGAVIPEGINRQRASDLIDETQRMRAQMRTALQNPITI